MAPALACQLTGAPEGAVSADSWMLVPATRPGGAPSIITAEAAAVTPAVVATLVCATSRTLDATSDAAALETVPIALKPTGPWLWLFQEDSAVSVPRPPATLSRLPVPTPTAAATL